MPDPSAFPALATSEANGHWEWAYLDLMGRIWTEGDERIDAILAGVAEPRHRDAVVPDRRD